MAKAKRTLEEALLASVASLTHRNLHSRARVLIAMMLGEDELADQFAAIELVNLAATHMPNEVAEYRSRLCNELEAKEAALLMAEAHERLKECY